MRCTAREDMGDNDDTDPGQDQEWLRESDLINGGLILIGVDRSQLVVWARVVAQNLALVGAVAGFWHIWWIAGVGMLAAGLVAVSVYAAGYLGLGPGQTPTAQEDRGH